MSCPRPWPAQAPPPSRRYRLPTWAILPSRVSSHTARARPVVAGQSSSSIVPRAIDYSVPARGQGRLDGTARPPPGTVPNTAEDRAGLRPRGPPAGWIVWLPRHQPCLVSQKILLISSILPSNWSATAGSVLDLVPPPPPASLVASLTSWFSCGYFSKCGGLKESVHSTPRG